MARRCLRRVTSLSCTRLHARWSRLAAWAGGRNSLSQDMVAVSAGPAQEPQRRSVYPREHLTIVRLYEIRGRIPSVANPLCMV
jgi:hypothetical protein